MGDHWAQIAAVIVTWILAAVGTFIILKVLDATMGLRVSREAEMEGSTSVSMTKKVTSSSERLSESRPSPHPKEAIVKKVEAIIRHFKLDDVKEP